MISLDRNDWEAINFYYYCFAYFVSLETEEILQKVLDVRGTSFQRKKLMGLFFIPLYVMLVSVALILT